MVVLIYALSLLLIFWGNKIYLIKTKINWKTNDLIERGFSMFVLHAVKVSCIWLQNIKPLSVTSPYWKYYSTFLVVCLSSIYVSSNDVSLSLNVSEFFKVVDYMTKHL